MGRARAIVGIWVVCSLLLLGAGLTDGQKQKQKQKKQQKEGDDSKTCDPSTKVAFDPPVEASDVTPLLQIEVPASCGDFQVAELLVCQEDIGFEEGCCDQPCVDMLTSVDNTCFGDFIQAACDSNLEKSIKILDNLAQRCNDEYVPVACSVDKADTPATAEEPTESSAEPEEAPTNFFGQSSDSPAEPEEAPTNFFGQSSDSITEPQVGTEAVEAAEAEICNEKTIMAEEEADVNKLVTLATLAIPPSCGDFKATDLLSCEEEINIVQGCCQESCKTSLEPISRECFEDLAVTICASEGADSLPILQNIFLRCHDDPFETTCSELDTLDKADTPATAEEPTESSAEPEEAPTNFFGQSSDSPAEPDETQKGSGECSGEKDINFNIEKITQASNSVDSQRCPDLFQKDILKCEQDMEILDSEDDCCYADCKKFIESLSEDCFSEIAMKICAQDADINHIFQRTAARCLDSYETRTCLGAKGAAGQQSTFTWAVLGSLLLIAMLAC